MPETSLPISQILRNYRLNLPLFPPRLEGARRAHTLFLKFYPGFEAAAGALGIPPADQPVLLERAQKVLWGFAREGRLEGQTLILEGAALQSALRFPRPEACLALLCALGAQVELQGVEGWQAAGASKVKGSSAGRLSFPTQPGLAADFTDLARAILAVSPKEKPAFERFLRADPEAVLAGEKPPLALPADAPGILANLSEGPAAAWSELVRALAGFEAYRPTVEFRNIQHGMWVVNYNGLRGAGRDLCGLILQNGTMQVRAILYEKQHFYVQEHLAEFGEPVQAAFHSAHYYEEFKHQWLFIDCKQLKDAKAVLELLSQVIAKKG